MIFVKWVLPILLFVLIAPWTPAIDPIITEYFYTPSSATEKGHFVVTPFLQFVFEHGEMPARIFAIIGFALLILSFIPKFSSSLKKWQKPSIAYLFTFIVGAGLITNVVLKQYWERPRPRQVVEYGGHELYHPFWKSISGDHSDAYRSFPCGHCTSGFVFFSLCLSGRRLKNPALFFTGLVLVVGLGIGMSLMRMAQGGHFFSDTLAAALLMWLCALTIDTLLFRNHE
jgi:membrane-associated PAP2 superfamily phosphatase